MIRVLFVCMGNICRSPMAEAVFKHLVDEAGLSDYFEIDSAGTISYHAGEPAHQGTRRILQHHQIAYHGRSRQVSLADLERFDYIIALDSDNLADLHVISRQGAQQRVFHRLLDFATQTDLRDVPDPYYANNFDYVYQLVDDGCRGLLARIRRDHNL